MKKLAKQIAQKIILLAAVALIFALSPQTSLAQEACCNQPYNYSARTGNCTSGFPGVPSQPTNCDAATEVCQNDVCVLRTAAQSPTPFQCGDLGQSCCMPGTGSPTCKGQYETSNNPKTQDEYKACTCVLQGQSNQPSSPLDPTAGCKGEQIDTALGCIPFNTDEFVPALLRFIIGFAGLAALVIMIIGSIVVITGGSNPEQVQKGKELFTSAIVGLLFIIFSVVILRIVAADIIQLPQFLPGN